MSNICQISDSYKTIKFFVGTLRVTLLSFVWSFTISVLPISQVSIYILPVFSTFLNAVLWCENRDYKGDSVGKKCNLFQILNKQYHWFLLRSINIIGLFLSLSIFNLNCILFHLYLFLLTFFYKKIYQEKEKYDFYIDLPLLLFILV